MGYTVWEMPVEALKNHHTKIKLGVSGAAETGHCGLNAFDKGKALGREIARHGAILINGATTGFPLWAAMGAKEENGMVVGFSPASSEKEHTDVYRLPTDYHDLIIYTGFGYPGRDLLLTRSSDALLFGCGRIGTIHEFTVAFEDRKPLGIFEADWEMDEVLKVILEKSHRPHDHVIFNQDPKALVEKIITMVEQGRKGRL